MEKIRPILYGVADYAEIRKANAWFVDRTAKIRDLEATRYAVFLRPRRFGKSLLTSILEAYYDVRYADRFDEFFAGTDIGANPTDERGKYLVLKFDFDENLRTDYAKIRHLVTMDRRLNGNFHVLENLLAGGSLEEPIAKSFQANELSKKENFTSLLYWLGITTITGDRRGKTVFGVPNETLKELAAKMIPAAYSDIHKIDERVFDINDGLCDFSYDGKWEKFIGILSGIVKENFAVRDAVEGEKVVQSTLVALLTAAKGPYLVSHEREVGGGFYDLALAPRLDRWPDIAHAALIEMKYVKAGDPAPTPEQLADIKAKAIDQLDRYSSDPALVAKWHLTGTTDVSSVALHRLVLVFHGGDCMLSEEV